MVAQDRKWPGSRKCHILVLHIFSSPGMLECRNSHPFPGDPFYLHWFLSIFITCRQFPRSGDGYSPPKGPPQTKTEVNCFKLPKIQNVLLQPMHCTLSSSNLILLVGCPRHTAPPPSASGIFLEHHLINPLRVGGIWFVWSTEGGLSRWVGG